MLKGLIEAFRVYLSILLTSAFEYSSKYFAKDLPHLYIFGFIEKPTSVKEGYDAVLTLLDKNTGFHHRPNVHLL